MINIAQHAAVFDLKKNKANIYINKQIFVLLIHKTFHFKLKIHLIINFVFLFNSFSLMILFVYTKYLTMNDNNFITLY